MFTSICPFTNYNQALLRIIHLSKRASQFHTHSISWYLCLENGKMAISIVIRQLHIRERLTKHVHRIWYYNSGYLHNNIIGCEFAQLVHIKALESIMKSLTRKLLHQWNHKLNCFITVLSGTLSPMQRRSSYFLFLGVKLLITKMTNDCTHTRCTNKVWT